MASTIWPMTFCVRRLLPNFLADLTYSKILVKKSCQFVNIEYTITLDKSFWTHKYLFSGVCVEQQRVGLEAADREEAGPLQNEHDG